MRHEKRPTNKRTARQLTPSELRSRNAFVTVVQDKLFALGDFRHLRIRHDGQHMVVEHPGPVDTPEETVPVFRLTPLGGLPIHFGLSFATHDNRWEKLPVSGLLDAVLSSAVELLAPYLVADTLLSDTSGTDN